MNRTDIRFTDDYLCPHPGHVARDEAVKKRVAELRAADPRADAAVILTKVRGELRRRGQAEPVGLARLVEYMLR